MASRGKMAGLTFDDMTKDRARHKSSSNSPLPSPAKSLSRHVLRANSEVSPLGSLTDPLVQDINHASRKYLFYCELASRSRSVLDTNHRYIVVASDVCRDLVVYDIPKKNPFRALIPLTHQHPVLLETIIANSALHMSNVYQKSSALDPTTFPFGCRISSLESACSSSSAFQQPRSYNDALAAKQQALRFLRSNLVNIASADIDVTLAAVLLLIEFELIDSGRDNWRYHVNGARTIIKTLCNSNLSMQGAMSPLRKCLVSNCLVFVPPSIRDIFQHVLT